MISSTDPDLIITEEVFNSFDVFDQALVIVLEKSGKVEIIRKSKEGVPA